jgi:hypothetical protein
MPKNSNDQPRRSTERRGAKWRASQLLTQANGSEVDPMDPESVRATWARDFSLVKETPECPGLRTPQVGAVHALLGYWTTDPKLPATIVMPTGTGKTDTMVTAMVATRIERLLVVVPSDALRDQLAAKFETLGVLPQLGLVPASAAMPVVGKLSRSQIRRPRFDPLSYRGSRISLSTRHITCQREPGERSGTGFSQSPSYSSRRRPTARTGSTSGAASFTRFHFAKPNDRDISRASGSTPSWNLSIPTWPLQSVRSPPSALT